MPVGISSAARNLFLLGSSGADVVTNFFKAIDQSASGDDQFAAKAIKYSEYDEKFILGLKAEDGNSKKHALVEKRDANGVLDWNFEIEALDSSDTILTDIHLDVNGKLLAVGQVGDVPFVARYTNNGVIEWSSTTNSGGVKYHSITSDSSGQYYACGNTNAVTGAAQAFVENYDANGNPGWGKSAINIGSDIVLLAIDSNSRGEVVAGGYLQDTNNNFKGYFVKLDTATGNVLWDRTLEITNRDWGTVPVTEINDVMIDGNDFIYLVGAQFDGVSGNSAGFICKYSPEGNMLWQKETPLNPANLGRWRYNCVEADTATGQIVILGSYFENTSDEYGVLVKYSSDGTKVFTRVLESTESSPPEFGKLTTSRGGMALDADPSFYYILFTDQETDPANLIPDKYTFGKVSSSGNGLGAFSYETGDLNTIEYYIQDIGDRIGRLSDGSVRNDTSDLATNILNPTKIMFDDLATPIANKKRQMNRAGDFEYSGSPAIRVADFQELNLLGDVYSGSGDWLDQSGKGNNAITSFTTTTTTGATTESENFRTVTSSYSTYGTVAENTVTNDLPYNNADWSHYGGKVRDLQTGGFRIDLTGNSTSTDFFMACWVKFDTYAVSRQMGIDLFGDYVYWETLANGAIAVRHNGGSRADSSATSLNDGNWHHIALSRIGGTLHGMLDGSSVISTTSGVSGNSVNSNENFWFFGGSGNAYITDAKILDPIIAIGTGTSGYTVPTEPVIDANGTFPNASPHVPFFSNSWAYISPAVSLGGTTTTTTNGPTHNAAGYWEFDGVDDYISLGTQDFITTQHSVEMWVYITSDKEHYLFSFGYQDDNSAILFLDTSDQELLAVWRVNGGNQPTITTGEILSLNQWYHIVWTRDGATNKIYLDGVEVGSSTNQTTISLPACIYDIGWATTRDKATAYTQGRVGDVRIYPRDLTAAQVFQNYNATKSKYINEAPDTAPKIGPGIVYGSELTLNYDFGNRATYDRAENLVLNSNDLNSTYWQIGGGQGLPTRTQDALSPVGDLTAWTVDDTAAGADGQGMDANISGLTASSTQTYTMSVYAKQGTAAKFDMYCFFKPTIRGTRLSYTWDTHQIFTNGSDNGGADVVSSGQESIGNGWYRIWMEVVDSTLGTNTELEFRLYPASRDTGPTGSTLFWNPQVVKGSDPGRAIKTYGSAITAPTKVKNLSSTSYTGTIFGATFNPAGYFEFNNDGTTMTDWIRVPSFTGFPGGNNSYSLSFWMRTNFTDSTDNPEAVFFYGNQLEGEAIRIRVNINGALRAGHWGGAGYDWTTPDGVISSNTWHHVCETYDGTTNENIIYVDGTQAQTPQTINNLSIPSSANLYLGRRISSGSDAPSGDYNGDIGGLLVYNRTLTATEVSQNFNATRSKYGV